MSERAGLLVDALGLDVPSTWIARLAPSLRPEYLKVACHRTFLKAAPIGGGLQDAALVSDDPEVRARAITLLSLRGDFELARKALASCGSSQWERGARAFAALTEGRVVEARDLFREAAVGSRKQRVELPDYLAVFDLLLTVTSDVASEAADVPRRIERAKRQLGEVFEAQCALRDLASFRQTGRAGEVLVNAYTWIDAMVCALRDAWTGRDGRAHELLAKHLSRARASGYAWLTSQIERIQARDARGSLLSLFERKEGWELALDALVTAGAEEVTRGESPGAASGDAQVVWWTVDLKLHSATMLWMDLEAHLVTKRAAKGKRMSIGKAAGDPTFPLDDQDRRVVASYLAASDSYSTGRALSVLPALVGHPRVRDTQGRHVRVERGEPTLHVVERRDGATLRLSPSTYDHDGMAVERPEADRIVIYERTGVAARVQKILGGAELHVPAQGLPRMSAALVALGTGLKVDAARSVARDGGVADARLRVQLFRAGSGLRARVRVVPGGAVGPALRPGQPPAEIMIGSEGGLVRLKRDLAVEAAHYDALLGMCPTLHRSRRRVAEARRSLLPRQVPRHRGPLSAVLRAYRW